MSAPLDLPRATKLIADKGIELLTFRTPNGQKLSILLEELGLPYTAQTISVRHGIQKEPWYTDLNPNGKIPTIVDHDNGDFVVFESLAILIYLVRTYDRENKFFFTDLKDMSRCEQWLAFHTAEVMPASISAIEFYRWLPEKGECHPFAMQKFIGECERIYGVLDKALEDRDYLVGPGKGKYSIADIANWTFIDISGFCGVGTDLGKWPNLVSWHKRIAERPAVKKGLQVPLPPFARNELLLQRMAEDPEEANKEAGMLERLKNAQEQYGYRYKSP